jgi:thiamine pyrophosphokinase
LRGIAIVGGEGPSPRALKKIADGADLLAAADSGLAAAEKAGLAPDWILGDMDSIDDPARLLKYPPDKIRRFPHDKDFTDTELAVALLWEKGCDDVWIAGGGGGRTDHLFAIRALFEREKCPGRWYTGREEIRCVKDGMTLNAVIPPHGTVSVFPLGRAPWEAESSGLKWPLNGLKWNEGFFGISNSSTEKSFSIRSVRGRFMVIMPMFFDN